MDGKVRGVASALIGVRVMTFTSISRGTERSGSSCEHAVTMPSKLLAKKYKRYYTFLDNNQSQFAERPPSEHVRCRRSKLEFGTGHPLCASLTDRRTGLTVLRLEKQVCDQKCRGSRLSPESPSVHFSSPHTHDQSLDEKPFQFVHFLRSAERPRSESGILIFR